MKEKSNNLTVEDVINKYYGVPENYNYHYSYKGGCGDSMEFFLNIKDNKIIEIKYKTDGCIYTKASGAVVCYYSENKNIEDAMFISPGFINKILKYLPEEHIHCPVLAATTFYMAISKYLLKGGKNG